MRTMFKRLPLLLGLISVPLAWTSCQDSLEEHTQVPKWIKGSIYEILQDRGNYTIFLKGVDMCDYTALLQGRSILTVMAPDDDAMRTFLKENYGTDDIAQLPLDQVKKLIGYHLLYYSFDKDKLVNFRPGEGDGATDEQKNVNAGMYYKFRTRSQEAPEVVASTGVNDSLTVGVYDYSVTPAKMNISKNPDYQKIDVYHLERFIPVFSYRMFNTKVIDAKYNYEYFYPHSQWKGDEGFNVSNAAVDEYAVIAKNGYIYFVDQTIRPLETIHKELENAGNYNMYLKLYDEYSYWAEDQELTSKYGGGSTTYFQRRYLTDRFPLVNIDSEWPVSNYAQMSLLASTAYTIFAPTDEAFSNFYKDYWGLEGTGYPTAVSYDSIASDAIGLLLSNSLAYLKRNNSYSAAIVFPEEIKKGEVYNRNEGTVISLDVDNIPEENRKICVNGILYGCNVLTPPAAMGCVTGPAYQYKRYSNFLTMLNSSSLLSTLTLPYVNYIMIYPSNEQFAANNIWYDDATKKLKQGTANLGSAQQSAYVQAHIVNLEEGAQQLPNDAQYRVYRTFSTNSRLYWYVNNGRITNSFKWNNLIQYSGNETTEDDVFADFKELTFRGNAWSNGHCYEYDVNDQKKLMEGDLSNAIYSNFIPMCYTHRMDEGTLFQGFIRILDLAEMIDAQSQSMKFMSENCLMLVPTTSAIKEAIMGGKFPYVSTTSTSADDPAFFDNCVVEEGSMDMLRYYLYQYFLPESTSPSVEYPYVGWGCEAEPTPSIADLTTTPATCVNVLIYDNGQKLSAKVDGMDHTVDFYDGFHYLPFVFGDGCVQFMNGIFENKWPYENN